MDVDQDWTHTPLPTGVRLYVVAIYWSLTQYQRDTSVKGGLSLESVLDFLALFSSVSLSLSLSGSFKKQRTTQGLHHAHHRRASPRGAFFSIF